MGSTVAEGGGNLVLGAENKKFKTKGKHSELEKNLFPSFKKTYFQILIVYESAFLCCHIFVSL